ncbi:conserved hypothetical protein [Marinoscillum sp. 108]|nr:conserved hypothetical protein [Marinoscillum sp. 108]
MTAESQMRTHMNKLLILLFLTSLNLTLNAQEIEEFFTPEHPFTHLFDTTIHETKISWRFETIHNNYIIQQFEEEGTIFRVKYRDFQLRVITPNSNQVFNKMYFQDSIGFDPEMFTMKLLGLEGYDEQTNELQFFLTITKPETDWTYPIYLYVNMDGVSRFELPTFEDDY